MSDVRTMYSTGEAARRLEVSDQTVRNFVEKGTLPLAARTERGESLFDPEVIERLRQQRAAKKGQRAS